MREKLQRFLSTLFEALPSTLLLGIRDRAANVVSKRPQLLSKRAVRFFLFGVLKVQLATVPVLERHE